MKSLVFERRRIKLDVGEQIKVKPIAVRGKKYL
jgi:hypothetical protein